MLAPRDLAKLALSGAGTPAHAHSHLLVLVTHCRIRRRCLFILVVDNGATSLDQLGEVGLHAGWAL